jgi:hypothetical protein
MTTQLTPAEHFISSTRTANHGMEAAKQNKTRGHLPITNLLYQVICVISPFFFTIHMRRFQSDLVW